MNDEFMFPGKVANQSDSGRVIKEKVKKALPDICQTRERCKKPIGKPRELAGNEQQTR